MTSYVNRLISDYWDETSCGEKEVLNPTTQDVQAAILALDAETKTMVSLYGDEDAYMTIGGGAGQYVVYVSPSEDVFWSLVAVGKKQDMVLINIGGQVGDFQAKHVLPLQETFQAAQSFLKMGKMDSLLHWEKRHGSQ